MVRILATDDQIRQMNEADETIEFVDAAGIRLGVFAKSADLEDLRIARERLASDEDRLPYSAVLDYLASLDH
jgi:hypothetical protein